MVGDNEGGSGVKSVSQAIRILNIVAEMNGPVSLKEIAARAEVAPSKAHRYLQSLCTCGFLSQASKSGAYDLGMQTLRLGLAAATFIVTQTVADPTVARQSSGDCGGGDLCLPRHILDTHTCVSCFLSSGCGLQNTCRTVCRIVFHG